MDQPNDRFERTQVDWFSSIGLLVLSVVLFALFYPHHEFIRGDKMRIYPLCGALGLFLLMFYKAFLKPHAYRFQPDGTLLLKSVFFPKALPIAQLESVTITQTMDRKGPKDVYTLLLKGGDPIELPHLGNMRLFLEKLSTLNPEMEVRDRHPKP